MAGIKKKKAEKPIIMYKRIAENNTEKNRFTGLNRSITEGFSPRAALIDA
jgi:hypothetical protein